MACFLKLYWHTARSTCLYIICGCFCMQQSWVVVTDYMDHKTENSYYLDFYRKSLPTSDLNQPLHSRDVEIGNYIGCAIWENRWQNSLTPQCQDLELYSFKVSVRQRAFSHLLEALFYLPRQGVPPPTTLHAYHGGDRMKTLLYSYNIQTSLHHCIYHAEL